MKQDFLGNFRVNVTWLFAFFSGLLAWTESCSFWYGWKGYSWHDLNHTSCISFACGQELFNNFFRIRLSVVCCRIQQLTKIVRNLSTFIRVCISNLLICYRIQQKIHETHKIWHPSEQNYLFVHFNQRQQYFQGVCKNFSKSLPWGWYGYFLEPQNR